MVLSKSLIGSGFASGSTSSIALPTGSCCSGHDTVLAEVVLAISAASNSLNKCWLVSTIFIYDVYNYTKWKNEF